MASSIGYLYKYAWEDGHLGYGQADGSSMCIYAQIYMVNITKA